MHFLASEVSACVDDGKNGSIIAFSSLAFSLAFLSSLAFAARAFFSSFAFSLALFLSSLAFSLALFFSSFAFSAADFLSSLIIFLSSLVIFFSSFAFSATGFLSSLDFVAAVVSSLDLATSFAGIIFPRWRFPSLNSPTNLSRFGYIKVPFPLGLSSLNSPTYFSPSGQVRDPWPFFLSSFQSPTY